MPEFIFIAYPWLKALHLVSVILWMGSQFLLPSLLAAHRGLPLSSAQAVLLTHIERKLIRYIMNPAMLAAFVFGALLAGTVIDSAGRLPLWLGFKFGFVFVLAALHGKLLRQFWRARDGRALWTSTGYCWVQGFNFVLLAAIVALVMVKPF